MTNFKIKLVSQANTILALLVFFGALFLFVPVRIYFLPQKLHPAFPLIFTILALLFLYFLFQKLARAWTEWTVNEDGIKIHWLTQFPFRHQDDILISWNEIDRYKTPASAMYNSLKISLKSGDILNFYHYNSRKDDFDMMLAALKTMYNQRRS